MKNTEAMLKNKKIVQSKMQQNTIANQPKTNLKISNADILTEAEYNRGNQTSESIVKRTEAMIKSDNRPTYAQLENRENFKMPTSDITAGVSTAAASNPIYEDRPIEQRGMLSIDQLHMLELIGGAAALIYIFTRA